MSGKSFLAAQEAGRWPALPSGGCNRSCGWDAGFLRSGGAPSNSPALLTEPLDVRSRLSHTAWVPCVIWFWRTEMIPQLILMEGLEGKLLRHWPWTVYSPWSIFPPISRVWKWKLRKVKWFAKVRVLGIRAVTTAWACPQTHAVLIYLFIFFLHFSIIEL